MRRLVMLLASVCCAQAHAAPAASIELRSEVRVPGGTVTLGDVARLQSSDLALMRMLVDLPVGTAPPAGHTSRLTRENLGRWLRRQAGLDSAVLAWSGAVESRLVREGVQVEGSAIGDAALAELRRWMAASRLGGDAGVASAPRDVYVAARRVRLQPRPLQAAHLRRRMIVWVDLVSDDSPLRTVPVTLDVQFDATLLQADARNLMAGRSGRSPAQEVPVVERGEWAALRSVTGAVVLESRVQVLQDGRPGERVRVRQQGATGIVFARVVERGVLELAP